MHHLRKMNRLHMDTNSTAHSPEVPPLAEELAAAMIAAYVIAFTFAHRWTVKRFGCVSVGGSPRWRNALGLLPQLVVLPFLLLLSVAAPSVALACERAFVIVFASILLFDFAVLELAPMLQLHHATCLVGHGFALWRAPEAFADYHAAVVALEVGSGLSSVWWLWGEVTSFPTPLYAVGMTASNGAAAWAALTWSMQAASLPVAARAVPLIITAALIYLRQVEMHNLLRYGRSACTTG